MQLIMTRRSSPQAAHCKLQSNTRRNRVVHLPVYSENAYQPMLMEAQRTLGWEVIDGGGGGNFLRTTLRVWQPDVLHFHWLHPYLLRASAIASWTRGLRFLAEVAWLRRRGVKVVWTVHNLANHGQQHARLERALTRRFVRQCDLIVAHGQYSAIAARERFRTPESTPIQVIRHPNYQHLDASASREVDLRARFGLRPQHFVIGFIGRVEPYKQVIPLVEAFRKLTADRARLLILGRPSSEQYAQAVKSAIGDDTRIIFRPEFIPHEELAACVRATDVVACTSRFILTSGSVILAMSFGRPVIAPSEGCIPEEVGTTGFLYDSANPGGIVEALKRALASTSDLAAMGKRANEIAQAASPERIARETISAYESVLKGNRRPRA